MTEKNVKQYTFDCEIKNGIIYALHDLNQRKNEFLENNILMA